MKNEADIRIHAAAIVETEHIGAGTRVWAHAHVMPGARIGRDCNLGDGVFVEGGAVVKDRVTLKNNVCVWEGITLEDDVFVGPLVVFTNDRRPRSPRGLKTCQRYSDKRWLESTVVEEGASIGAGAVICPGVRLGRYCIIAAGAVVTKDVQPFQLVMGNPARPSGFVCICGARLQNPCEYADRDYCECESRAAGVIE